MSSRKLKPSDQLSLPCKLETHSLAKRSIGPGDSEQRINRAAAPQLFLALKTIIKRGYKIEASDYYSAEAALKSAEGGTHE